MVEIEAQIVTEIEAEIETKKPASTLVDAGSDGRSGIDRRDE